LAALPPVMRPALWRGARWRCRDGRESCARTMRRPRRRYASSPLPIRPSELLVSGARIILLARTRPCPQFSCLLLPSCQDSVTRAKSPSTSLPRIQLARGGRLLFHRPLRLGLRLLRPGRLFGRAPQAARLVDSAHLLGHDPLLPV